MTPPWPDRTARSRWTLQNRLAASTIFAALMAAAFALYLHFAEGASWRDITAMLPFFTLFVFAGMYVLLRRRRP
jgi:hypothetical protein